MVSLCFGLFFIFIDTKAVFRAESALSTVWQSLEMRKSFGLHPPMFLVGLCGFGKGRFFPYGLAYCFQNCPTPRVKPTKAIGGFSFWVATFVTVLRTIASTEPGGAKEKGTGMGVWRNAPGANP